MWQFLTIDCGSIVLWQKPLIRAACTIKGTVLFWHENQFSIYIYKNKIDVYLTALEIADTTIDYNYKYIK